jgi:hypothetical protein
MIDSMVPTAAERIVYLEDCLRIIAETARINAAEKPGIPRCPVGMLAIYIQQEVAHALAGHIEPRYGVDCPICTDTA